MTPCAPGPPSSPYPLTAFISSPFKTRYDQNFDANQHVVDIIRQVGDEVGGTPAQVALAWLYAQGERYGLPVVPIPGTRRAQRIDENAGALALTLNQDQLARLGRAADLAQGGRNFSFATADWVSAGRE